MPSKSVLITGSSRGIGKAIALRLAKDGFNVAVTDLKKEEKEGQVLVEEIQKIGVKAVFIPLNVTIKSEFENAIQKTYEEFGGFDIIINNAAVMFISNLENLEDDSLQLLLDVNVKGVLYGMQTAFKKFKEIGKGGKILNAASIGSYTGVPGVGGYCATKFAVKALAQTAAKEFAPFGITVNNFCPGNTDTQMLDSVIDEKVELGFGSREELEKMHREGSVLKRLGKPDDIAGLVSFLCSEDSGFITGQSIIVDGGMVMT